MSNQIFANKTNKFIQGRQLVGTFLIQDLPVLTGPLILGPFTSKDIPIIVVTGNTLVPDIDMVLYMAVSVQVEKGTGDIRGLEIFHEGVQVAHSCITPNINEDSCLFITATIQASAGDAIQIGGLSDDAGIAVNDLISTYTITRLF